MISKIEYKMINSPNNLKSLKAFYTDFANQQIIIPPFPAVSPAFGDAAFDESIRVQKPRLR